MNSRVKKVQRRFEKNYVKFMGWQHIPNAMNDLIYLDIKLYKGKQVQLKDIKINPGDKIAEIHVDNLNIHKIDGSFKSIVKNFRNEMTCFINVMDEIEEYRDVKAIYGVTVLHPLLKILGFERFPVDNRIQRAYLRFWENMLKNSFSNIQSNRKKKLDPMICFISVNKLKEQGNCSKRGEK